MQTQYCNIGASASKMYSERTYCNISILYYVSQEYVLCYTATTIIPNINTHKPCTHVSSSCRGH